MMKLLFMDDMEERHVHLASKLDQCGMEITHSYTAQDAIAKLNTTVFDAVSLDHDMASEHYIRACSADSGCGCDVVDWICLNANRFTDTKFIIHSWNTDGVKRMHDALRKFNLDCLVKQFS